jgi:3'-5' exonuclease
VLDDAVDQLKRFLIVPGPTYLDTIALWSAHTYLLRNEAFGVGFTPLLAFQSPIKRWGKSTGLKCTHLMSYDARMASSITPSSLFRVVDEYGVSLLVDKADNVFKNEKSDLLGIMNAGRDRMTARVMRSEAVGDGKFETREFNTFPPIALTSIKQLSDTLQDRAIVLSLRRATYGERPERLTLRTRGPLIDIGRRLKALTLSLAAAKGKLAALRKGKAWAADIKTAAKQAKALDARRKMAGQAALDPHRSSIRIVQLHGGGDKVYIIDIARAGPDALRLLDGLNIVAHNAQSELKHLEHAGVELGEIYCTMQAARLLLGERRMSLADAAADYLGVVLDKDEQTSD